MALPKYRKAKRPTLLVNKRAQVKRKPLANKSRNLIYERLKANNVALAKALSKEKQENQFLFKQNINLTAQVQEKNVAINHRDGAMMGILKNSSEILTYLVEATDRVTRTIAACQKFVGVHKKPSPDTPSPVSSVPRRESARRSNVKSPARGVVQPMVSGHTITKPVINLSRINMPRIRTSPNLSDIEESLTPERPSNHANNSSNSGRMSRKQPTLLANRRVDGLMPERIRLTSPRMTDESDRLSNSRRSRHSRKFSRNSSSSSSSSTNSPAVVNNRSRVSAEHQEMIRSPRVTLEDVSKLLQKSQSINVRTLLESSELMPNDSRQSANNLDNTTIDQPSSPSDSSRTIPTFGFLNKKNISNQNNSEDPLEGPSWRFDYLQSPIITNPDASPEAAADEVSVNEQRKSGSTRNSWSSKTYNVDNDDSDEDDGDKCINYRKYLPPFGLRERNHMADMSPGTIKLPENVTRRRGQPLMDDDDFTMLINRGPVQPTRHVPFDVNDLKLPVLETPLSHPDEIEREPEITTTVRMLTQPINRLQPENRENMSIMGENTSMICSMRDSNLRLSSDFEVERQSPVEDNTEALNRIQLKRKRVRKNRLESTSSDSESPCVTPKKTTLSGTSNRMRNKDPSAVKVVLEKLEERMNTKLSSAFSSRGSSNVSSLPNCSDVLSDSESSNASSKTSSARPRRQKAPANLMEPKLNTKLRRK